MRYHTPIACSFAALLLLAQFGCLGPSNSARLMSSQSQTELATDLTTRVYSGIDRNTADFYLTNLPPEAARPGTDPLTLTGTLIHVHLFLQPLAGRTPLGSDGCNVTVRQLVLSGGEAGIYAGGAFMTPRDAVGSQTSGGRFTHATLQLLARTKNFNDLLGPSEMSAEFNAARNEPAAQAWADLLTRSIALTKKP
ncbi:MAG: hypothetical protein AABZ53_07415 [Planctomycetota bacterium]